MNLLQRWFASLISHGRVLVSPNVLAVMVLLVIVELCAMSVVYTTYRNRVLFAELETLRDQAEELQSSWTQLLLEQSTLASFQRVSEVAGKHLGMTIPDPHATVVLRQQPLSSVLAK